MARFPRRFAYLHAARKANAIAVAAHAPNRLAERKYTSSKYMATKQQRAALTPIWVISLFLSLTEVVAGLAITKADGQVQVALAIFVIAFPTLVAALFFLVLWHKPFVLYPPREFGPTVSVDEYAKAMTSKVATVRAEVEAEAGNLRALIVRDMEAFGHRLGQIEHNVVELLNAHHDTARIVSGLDQSFHLSLSEERAEFDENSRYRVHVLATVHEGLSKPQRAAVSSLAESLTQLGFKTSSTDGAWGSYFFFPKWDESDRGDTIFVVYRDGFETLAVRLRSQLEGIVPDAPVEIISRSGAAAAARDPILFAEDNYGLEGVDATIVYAMRTEKST